jgi:hypoxia-inducible factor 1-alpha inhibitor (HIF hydroxylase)
MLRYQSGITIGAEVQRVPATNSEKLRSLIAQGLPVVITGTTFTNKLLSWTPDYLLEHIPPQATWSVHTSTTPFFRYWDNSKNKGKYIYEHPNQEVDMTFSDFHAQFQASAEAAVEPIAGDGKKSSEVSERKHLYLQANLTDKVGPQLKQDFGQIDWKQLAFFQQAGAWGPLTTNMLFVGEAGCTTPTHYDEQENLFFQVHGRKRFILLHPQMWKYLYLYPLNHTCDRQSRIDFEDPDVLNRFPRLRQAVAVDCELGPGDLLYVPVYWFHHVISLTHNVSINFWSKSSPNKPIVFPLPAVQFLAMTRNVERLLSEAVGPVNTDAFASQFLSGQTMQPDYKTVLDQLTTVVSHVMPTDQVRNFLTELFQDRYGILEQNPALVIPTKGKNNN